MNGRASEFPYGTRPDHSGGLHLEIADDGKMALVGTDRGIETVRHETGSVDELLYWVFRDFAYSRAFHNASKDYDFEKSQQAALDEIAKISPEWRAKLAAEQDQQRRA